MKASKIISLNFFDDLTSRYVTRRFLFGFIVLALSTFCIAIAISKRPIQSFWTETTVQLLLEICCASIIILFAYWLYLYFIGSNPAASKVSVTRPQDISEKMQSLPLNARNYMFWGRSGSFFRAHPLRVMDKQARETKRNVDVSVLLPNPNDTRLTESYRQILQSLGEDYGKNPLMPHVLATCIACATVSANNRHLNVQIYLSSFIPGFRLDLSDNGAILTQDDKKKSALHFTADSEFYDMWRSTMLDECNVSTKVEWSDPIFRSLTLNEPEYKTDTLRAFSIPFIDSEQLRSKVLSLVSDQLHRYK